MLPWNPPSSFSLGSDSQPQRYGNYSLDSGPSPHQQPQQPPHQQQQQQQPPPQGPNAQNGPPAPASAAPYPPMTLAATLHFLQSEHRRYARDRNEWEIERAEMRARIALLEGEKRGNEGALKSLGRRCKMLEMALRGERSKFLSTTNALAGQSPSVSGTASPIPGLASAPSGAKDATLASGPAGIPPAKLAALQKDAPAAPSSSSAPVTPAEAPKSAPMVTSTSSPGQAHASLPAPAPVGEKDKLAPGAAAAKTDTLGAPALNGYQTGTWGGTMGGPGGVGARDPRGKARSREYLKQCLQEITYLTSSATLNPLSAHSYAAPSVPRPRKTLPDHIPPSSAPGVISLAGGTGAAPAGSAQTGEVAPLADSGSAPSTAPAPPMSLPIPPAPISSAAPVAGDASTSKQDLLTSFPSDPPSAFVPLKRQISQPGQHGRRSAAPAAAPVPTAAPLVPEVKVDLPAFEAAKVKKTDEAEAEQEKAPEKEEEKAEEKEEEEEKDLPPPEKDNDMDRAIADLAAERDVPPPVAAAEDAAPAPMEVKDEDLAPQDEAAAAPEPLLAPDAGVENAAPGAAAEKAAPPPSDAAEESKPDAALAAEDEPESAAEDAGSPAPVDVPDVPPEQLAAPEVNDEMPTAEDAEVAEAAAERTGEAEKESEPKSVTEEKSGMEEEEEGKELDSARVSDGGGDSGVGVSELGGAGGDGEGASGEVVTAIFRPSSADEWRDKLREAGRRAYPSLAGAGGDAELEGLEWDLDAGSDADETSGSDESLGRKGKGGGGKTGKKADAGRRQASEDTVGLKDGERFKARRVLKSHLEAVRVVVVADGEGGKEDVEVVSAGDDHVVKLWRGAAGKGGPRSDLEPVITYRGHTAPVTALATTFSPPSGERIVFSASLDSTIRIWRAPSTSHNIYDPVDPSLSLGVLDPRADAIWGLAVLNQGSRLACITADGSIQLWDWEAAALVRSWTYGAPDAPLDGKGSLRKRPGPLPTPTALVAATLSIDGGEQKEYLVVAFQNAVVKVFDGETGDEVKRIDADETYDGTADTQINSVTVLPSHGLLATAHEDRFIRIFNLESGSTLLSTIAHLDGVTALSFLPASPNSTTVYLASTSHDASFRIWSFDRGTGSAKPSLTCVQEASTHRVKGAEGVLDVALSGAGDVAVTAGADGTVRVWEK
ncbi:hypothetical protein JCM10207_002134 [Rhodosporidiobolus poonsookiae]